MPSVTVYARTNAIAQYLKHSTGMSFDLTNNSSVWPDDNFTARRIADGDVFTSPVQGLVPAGRLTIIGLVPPPTVYVPTVVKTGP